MDLSRKIIKVETRYISEDTNFRLPKAAVVDKVVPGCGLTTFVLSSEEDLILAEPTIALVTNKCSQSIPGQTILSYSDLLKRRKGSVSGIKEGCCKIITTFDSILKLDSFLQKGWRLVVDEYQDLFTRFRLKGETYSELLDLLEKYKDQITFISATTIPEKYEPDWIANLDHYKIKFNPEYLRSPVPITIKTDNPLRAFTNEILKPILEKGSVFLGDKSFSKCIVFCNSLGAIARIVRGLDQSRYAVMCSENSENDKYLAKKLIPRFIQTETSLHNLPDFLFVTGVGFEGLDLYSKEHMTVLLSFPTKNKYRSESVEDSKNYSLLSLDIDMLQILARNRDLDNPCRDRYVFIYNSSIVDEALESELENIGKAKRDLKNQFNSSKVWDTDVNIAGYELFIKDSKGVYRNNKLGLDYSEYLIKDVAERYRNGKFEILMNTVKAFKEHELTWEYIRDKYVRLHETGVSEPWTVREKNSKYFKLILNCRACGLEIPKEFTQITKKIDRKVAQKAKKQPVPEVATELKKSLGIPGKYTKPQIKATLEKIYKRLKLDKKAFCTDILMYAEVSAYNSKENGKQVTKLKIKSWK